MVEFIGSTNVSASFTAVFGGGRGELDGIVGSNRAERETYVGSVTFVLQHADELNLDPQTRTRLQGYLNFIRSGRDCQQAGGLANIRDITLSFYEDAVSIFESEEYQGLLAQQAERPNAVRGRNLDAFAALTMDLAVRCDQLGTHRGMSRGAAPSGVVSHMPGAGEASASAEAPAPVFSNPMSEHFEPNPVIEANGDRAISSFDPETCGGSDDQNFGHSDNLNQESSNEDTSFPYRVDRSTTRGYRYLERADVNGDGVRDADERRYLMQIGEPEEGARRAVNFDLRYPATQSFSPPEEIEVQRERGSSVGFHLSDDGGDDI